MSKVWVNDKGPVEGRFSFKVTLNETVNPPIFAIDGIFECAVGYFDEIKSLANERYRLDRVNVIREDYGSEEDTILYHFRAGDYSMRDFEGGK